MFLLRRLLRGLTSSILRLAIVAAVLLLGFLLLVKPLLNSANDAIESTESRSRKAIHCIGHSHADVHRIERCTKRF